MWALFSGQMSASDLSDVSSTLGEKRATVDLLYKWTLEFSFVSGLVMGCSSI